MTNQFCPLLPVREKEREWEKKNEEEEDQEDEEDEDEGGVGELQRRNCLSQAFFSELLAVLQFPSLQSTGNQTDYPGIKLYSFPILTTTVLLP